MPPSPDLEYEWIHSNGLRFEVATCGQGDRLALCLHGFPESAYSWRYQIPVLAEQGYRVWAPNLRGYGRSDAPTRVADYAIEHLLEDIAGWIDAAGARSVTLLGHDWGAILAWYFAMRKLRSLERLVIMNVPHPAAFRDNTSWRQLRRSWYGIFFQLPWLPERLASARKGQVLARSLRDTACNPEQFPAPVLEEYRKNAATPAQVRPMLHYYRALVRGGGGRRQEKLGFPIIEVPTLMLWGEQDVALTKETTYGTDRYVEDLTLRYLPKASHWVQQDDPATVNAMLTAWLRGEPVPEAPA